MGAVRGRATMGYLLSHGVLKGSLAGCTVVKWDAVLRLRVKCLVERAQRRKKDSGMCILAINPKGVTELPKLIHASHASVMGLTPNLSEATVSFTGGAPNNNMRHALDCAVCLAPLNNGIESS
ncbi:hypothetical protein F5148DRAFT_727459 [Russula earlei]|uniref:Uncharacterized protein n=1 Tax=Russula earlei TaxID=71964 RepID=A0ACC0TUH2_9AGAM|nr:hypothetical protein F5148DRAFT_727459 [Russula earlei]